MKSKAIVQFVADHAERSAQNLYDFLRKTAMYNQVILSSTFEAQVYIEFNNPFDMKSQLHWLAVALLELPSWHFVGPPCPGLDKGIKHEVGRTHMGHINHPTKGEQWICHQARCRMNQDVVQDDFMTLGDFRMSMQILQNDPSPIRKLSTTPVWKRETLTKPVPFDTETSGIKPGRLPSRMDERNTLVMRRVMERITEDEAKKMLEELYKNFPALKNWHQMSELTRLSAENERIREELKESDEALSNSNTYLDELRSRTKQLEAMNMAEEPVVKAADAFLRLMAGFNMQDHSVLEQREFNTKFHALKDELMKLGIGSTPGKKCPS